MSAGARFEYHWQDGVNFKKPTKVSAPEYVDYLMDWVQKQLDDDAIFPSQIGA
jgi:MOB kinase activator 1